MEIRFVKGHFVKSISWKDQNVGPSPNDSFSHFFEFYFAVYILTKMMPSASLLGRGKKFFWENIKEIRH